MNINLKQSLAIGAAVLSVLMVSSSQLTDLFGPSMTKSITAAAGLANTLIASILAVISSQSGLLKDVQAMTGVDSIKVNAQANPTLAQLAVDPKQDKIEPTTQDKSAVEKIALDGGVGK